MLDLLHAFKYDTKFELDSRRLTDATWSFNSLTPLRPWDKIKVTENEQTGKAQYVVLTIRHSLKLVTFIVFNTIPLRLTRSHTDTCTPDERMHAHYAHIDQITILPPHPPDNTRIWWYKSVGYDYEHGDTQSQFRNKWQGSRKISSRPVKQFFFFWGGANSDHHRVTTVQAGTAFRLQDSYCWW